ncbi:MAG: ParB-like chromosome segregation protein Spo0J [Gammaproteobacteria bacterium]|jgi:ParB-like chromosome segregation protein Spo0J
MSGYNCHAGLRTQPYAQLLNWRRYAAWLDKLPEGRSHGTIAALARTASCSRSHIAHLLRLLRLPELIQQAVGEGLLNLGQAKAIAVIASVERQMQITTEAIRGPWSVRQTEKAARADSVSKQGRAVQRSANTEVAASIG